MSNMLFRRRVDGARAIASAIAVAISLGAYQAKAANTITFGDKNKGCGGDTMCSNDGTHGYTTDGTGQAFDLSTISQWFQIDVSGSSELSGQPAEPDGQSGKFLVVNDTGNAVTSFSLTLTDDFMAQTQSVHSCTGIQAGSLCDNFSGNGGNSGYKFATGLSGADWDRCTHGTTSGQTCTAYPGSVAADFAPNSVTYTWTAEKGSSIPAGAAFLITFAGWNNDGWAFQAPSNAYITNCGNGTVSVIDTSNNTVTATVAVGTCPFGVAVTPDKSKVYVVNEGSNSVSVIETSSNTVTATIAVGNQPAGAAVSPDGSEVYVSNSAINDNTISVIDTSSETVTATVNVIASTPFGLAFTPDGSKLYVTDRNSFTPTTSVFATPGNTLIAEPVVGLFPLGVAATPDGSTVYVASRYGNVAVIDTSTNTRTAYITAGSEPFGVVVSPDGSKAYVANTGDGTVSVIDVSSGSVTATIAVGSGPVGISITSDGSKLYVANEGSNSVSVIDTSSETVVATIAVGYLPIAFGNFIQ